MAKSLPEPANPNGSKLTLAKNIARALLMTQDTNGPVECTRLQQMLKQSNGTERNMGGHCKASVVDTILRALNEAGALVITRLEMEKLLGSAITHGRQLGETQMRVLELEAAIRWALGENGEFPAEPPHTPGKLRRRYYWRTELRERAKL